MMKQAQKMQDHMQKAQEELAALEVQGEAGGGMVRIRMTGRNEVKDIKIDENLITEDRDMLEDIAKNYLPSGSGIDSGCAIDVDASDSRKIFIDTSYHHMNDGGYYDGWTEHRITVSPSFDGIDIKISGRDRNQIKDYLHDVFYTALTADYVD